MIELSINNNQPVLQKDISKNQNISIKYLDQIISQLKIARLITSKKKGSGYLLTKSADSITLLDIFKAFDPYIISLDCITENSCHIKEKKLCGAHDFWLDFNKSVEEYLKNITIDELARKETKLMGKDISNYSI